jgi:16S rRNA (guanine527-N7)-methyltransferase
MSEDVAYDSQIDRLLDRLGGSGVGMRPEAGRHLKSLSRCMVRWNDSVNLVSRKDIGRLVTYHFCDSASLLPILKPTGQMTVLDLGGSNGLPGLVLAAISPHLKVTICDASRKRQAFLDEACAELGLGTAFEAERVNAGGFAARYQDFFDLIVARAVTKLKFLLRWCLPLLRPGGYLAAYKGSRCLAEASQAEHELLRYGGRLLMVVSSPWKLDCNPLRLFAIAERIGS